MITEEYRKELEDWLNNHTEYYNEYVRTMKNSKRATLATYMHIYDYAMRNIPGIPDSVELGACSNLFHSYYEKYGFSDLVGMHFLVAGNDKWLGLKSLAQQNKLKMAISAWLVIGDLQIVIISMIQNHPNRTKFRDALDELETRIIRNSIVSGLKGSEYWYSKKVFSKLSLSEEDLNECIMSCLPQKPEKLKKVSKTEEVMKQNQISENENTDTNGLPKEKSLEEKLRNMRSFHPTGDDGPNFAVLYKYLINQKQIHDVDEELFCACVNHAYFIPFYVSGVRVNILYTIRYLKGYYDRDWLEAVCNNIKIEPKRVTQNTPKNSFVEHFPL